MVTTAELERRILAQQGSIEELQALVRQNADYAARHGDEHFFEGNDPVVPHVAVRDNTATLTTPARYSGLPKEVGRRPRLNFIPGTGVGLTFTDDATDDEIDITIACTTGGVMGSCHDYIAIASYTGTEGASITIPDTSHVTRFYSSVESAVDHGIANLSRNFSILACGTFNEDVTVEAFNSEIHIFGLGRDMTTLGGSAGNLQVEDEVWLYDLTLHGPAAGWSLEQLSGTNMEIHAEHVAFVRKMAGDHGGSMFLDCDWQAGMDFQSAGESPSGIADGPGMTIIGGECSGDIDFTNAGSANGWQVRGLNMSGGSLILKDVSDSFFGISFQTAGGSRDDQVLFSGDCSDIILDCVFGRMDSEKAVVRVASGVTASRVALRGNFDLSAASTGAASRFVKVEGTAEAWHIDCQFPTDGSANYIEQQSTPGKSVSGVFTNSKFTLVPASIAEVNTTAGSSGNIVDSGVITSGSVGVSGPGVLNVTTITGNTTLTNSQTVVLCDASGGAITVTLPAASGNDGRHYHVKKIDSSGNAVTIDGDGSETIDGEITQVITMQYNSINVVCDGSAWHIL